ncbi:hypothetical protein DUNSADRAFT_8861 [Dunaliella salina]|uniref:Secreted protein n=1 Tax=Dunaliella salina TaxID=3046 RepID=A0ABQ7H5N9_DUNSA|nr:hypothetical protein DUNSADRAFT_8861 [Dunaliella salina]|eukprot:KAF5842174.1 hypothetical protein DUNSADRAFT_8861 [Dunaliella salina]
MRKSGSVLQAITLHTIYLVLATGSALRKWADNKAVSCILPFCDSAHFIVPTTRAVETTMGFLRNGLCRSVHHGTLPSGLSCYGLIEKDSLLI